MKLAQYVRMARLIPIFMFQRNIVATPRSGFRNIAPLAVVFDEPSALPLSGAGPDSEPADIRWRPVAQDDLRTVQCVIKRHFEKQTPKKKTS